MSKIFICYRKNDSEDVVGRIYERLSKHFWKRLIFKDVDSILPGRSFPVSIKNALDKTWAMTVVIGPGWINAKNDLGERRLENPEDFVRLELEIAHKLQVPIIPVLLGNTPLPTVGELPPSLNFLPLLQSLSIRPDPDFQNDIGRLCGVLEKYTDWPWLWIKKTFWIMIGVILVSGVLVWRLSMDNESLTVKTLNPTKVVSKPKLDFIDNLDEKGQETGVKEIQLKSKEDEIYKEIMKKLDSLKRVTENKDFQRPPPNAKSEDTEKPTDISMQIKLQQNYRLLSDNAGEQIAGSTPRSSMTSPQYEQSIEKMKKELRRLFEDFLRDIDIPSRIDYEPSQKFDNRDAFQNRKKDLKIQILAPVYPGNIPSPILNPSPTLFWYTSVDINFPVEFRLKDSKNRTVKKIIISNKIDTGIHEVSLKDMGLTLEPGVDYVWSIYGDFNPLKPDLNPYSQAAIQVKKDSANVVQRLQGKPDLKKTKANLSKTQEYAKDGYWYDAFMILSDLVNTYPGNCELVKLRSTLLEKQDVNLGTVAKALIKQAGCSQVKKG